MIVRSFLSTSEASIHLINLQTKRYYRTQENVEKNIKVERTSRFQTSGSVPGEDFDMQNSKLQLKMANTFNQSRKEQDFKFSKNEVELLCPYNSAP